MKLIILEKEERVFCSWRMSICSTYGELQTKDAGRLQGWEIHFLDYAYMLQV